MNDDQRKLLESRYDPDAAARSQRQNVARQAARCWPNGPPAARHDWDDSGVDVAGRNPAAERCFPIPRCRIRCRPTADRSFPKMQIEMFPALAAVRRRFRFARGVPARVSAGDFSAATGPELGDVSRGEVVSINNYYRLFKDILTPVQLDGLRLLLTPFPQEEFNPTDDRKIAGAEPRRRPASIAMSTATRPASFI